MILWLIFIGLAVYLPTCAYPFVHDDLVFIRHNPAIADLRHPFAFLLPSVETQTTENINLYYRPLLEWLYRAQYRVFGFNPAGYHAFNVVLHLLNAGFVFLILRTLLRHLGLDTGKAAGLAFMTAAVFLVHPVQSEAVACVAGVSNLLSAALVFAALGLYPGVRGRGGWRLTTASVIFFACSLLVKEQGIIFPLLLGWYECFRVRETGRGGTWRRQALGRVLPFAGAALLYMVWRFVFLGGRGTPFWIYGHELILRLAAVPAALLMYLKILVWPADLHYYRSLDILAPQAAAWMGLTALALVLTLVLRRMPETSRRIMAFGTGWFFITLLPMLNIMPLIHEYSWIAAFEHFLYVPLIGAGLAFFAGAEALLADVPPERARMWQRAGGTALILVLMMLTVQQNRFWRRETVLFERAARFEPELARVRRLLGRAYYGAGDFSRALPELMRAARMMEGYASKAAGTPAEAFYLGFIKDTLFEAAHCYEALGDDRQAEAVYQQALALDPHDGDILNNLGAVYLRQGQWGRAGAVLEEARRMKPQDPSLLNNLAVCYIQQHLEEQARVLLEEVVRQYPDFVPARQNLDRLLDGFFSGE